MTHVAIYPDLDGKELAAGGFADTLLDRHPVVVAVVNGSRGPDKEPTRDRLHIVHSPQRGLAGALPMGYYHARTLGDVVLRLDTNEHPHEAAQQVVEAARVHGGAIGDPAFGARTLTSHTPDQLAQRDIFPALFRNVTGGQLALTGSHGLQAWRSSTLDQVLPVAEDLFRMASGPDPMPWGFDAAMALAALQVDTPPHVLRYTPRSMRNRHRTRISSQYECVLRVCLAYLVQRGDRYDRANRDAILPDRHEGDDWEQLGV